jgi:DNA/RNA endonuclease G (NUC1)
MSSIPSGSRWSARRKWLLVAAPAALFVACVSGDRITGLQPHDRAALDLSKGGGVVISQVYGGGGNSGATLTNDFIELHNAGGASVDVTGWSVQYASASGTTWQVTTLRGTIEPGGYYLVQEAKGNGGTQPLPAPDATGSIAMSGTDGKVALVGSATALSGSCPTAVIDFVGFGSANCFEGTAATARLSNTTAASRKVDGNQDTDDNAADFTTGAPAPRNSATTPNGSGVIAGPFDHIVITGGSTVERGRTVTLTASLQDARNIPIDDPGATYSWTPLDGDIARITATNGNQATVTGLAEGGPVTFTVSATSHGHTHSADFAVTVVPRVLGHVTLSAGTSPLVIGYQTQLFVGGTDDSGAPVDFSTITWSTSDANIVSVDDRGLITGAGAGTATLKATAPDGSFATLAMTTEVPFYNANARLGHNTEFGTPTDADARDDIIIAREQYTISYNPQRGGPNWVSWDLSATHLGSRNRCNCYSADTALVRLGYGQYMYTTLDYTGGGYDRGHMEPSADQTATDGENARTFFLTNFLPQKHGLNAGPWEDLENELRDSVRAGREAYIIAGGIFTGGVGLGTLKGEGRIAIPDSTWKIVVMMPEGEGLANVTSASDVNVFAVNMPNVDNPGSNDWRNYRTTVAKIQQSTGYDFLSSLPEAIQCKVEQRNCAPVVNAFAGATILVGETYGASGSFTDAATDSWTGTASYGDGSVTPLAISGTTFSLSHRYTRAGTFTVTATVRDQLGAAGSASATVVVQSSLTGVQNLGAMLASSGLPNTNSLEAKLGAASKQLASGDGTAAANQLGAFQNELAAMVRSGRVAEGDAAPLQAYADRVIDSIR